MSSWPQTTNQPLIHHHTLTYRCNVAGNFTCSGCKLTGCGPRYVGTYGCACCFHPRCATAPQRIQSYKHALGPAHQLCLLNQTCRYLTCSCCCRPICGLYYKCSIQCCWFVAHPTCAQWPQYVGHPRHPGCRLRLVRPGTDSCCDACGRLCNTWRYRCDRCCVDIHRICCIGRGQNPYPAPPIYQNPVRRY